MTLREVNELLTIFVRRNSDIIGMEWDPALSEKLLFNPFNKLAEGKKQIAHYFLLVAAITESNLIGRAENSRAFLVHLHRFLGDDVYNIQNLNTLDDFIDKFSFHNQLGPEKQDIPNVISSVNKYVKEVADGDLVTYSKKFPTPSDFVKDISEHIYRMDELNTTKAWIYLRWSTRPSDLGIYTQFNQRDLQIPLSSYIVDVVCCLGICDDFGDDWWIDPLLVNEARFKVTEYAKGLFPEDPTIVDYPLYLLGRWIRGKPRTLDTIHSYLLFIQELYEKTGTLPVTYDIVSRTSSNFEDRVQEELDKLGILFYYESHTFNLTRRITYKPDFVLPNNKIKGKTVLLEPHGIWDLPTKRRIKIGNRLMTVEAYGPEKDPEEQKLVTKYRLFRETFGQDYHLILFVPSRFYDRVKTWYPDAYDEIYQGSDIPKVLYQINS